MASATVPGEVGTAVGQDAAGRAVVRVYLTAAGVAAIPLQVFHPDAPPATPARPSPDARWIRLAFCKDDDAMREGVTRLAAHRDQAA